MSRPAPNPPPSHATPRLKIEKPDFAALRARRDGAINALIDAACAERGWDRSTVQVHVSGRGGCTCACPDGPCEHEFAGWRESGTPEGGVVGEQVCRKCGAGAMSHSLRYGP